MEKSNSSRLFPLPSILFCDRGGDANQMEGKEKVFCSPSLQTICHTYICFHHSIKWATPLNKPKWSRHLGCRQASQGKEEMDTGESVQLVNLSRLSNPLPSVILSIVFLALRHPVSSYHHIFACPIFCATNIFEKINFTTLRLPIPSAWSAITENK